MFLLWLASTLLSIQPVAAQDRLPVIPALGCILLPPQGEGLLIAQLGYVNPNPEPVTLPLGALNLFSPTPINRGQPTEFQPGAHHNLFVVEFSSSLFSRLDWILDGQLLRIDANAPRCQSGALALSVSGGGRVRTADGTLDCTTSCIRAFVEPESHILFALRDPGWVFAGWDGGPGCADGQVQIEVGEVRSCRARFEPEPTRAVAVAVLGPGQVALGPGGPLCPAERCVLNLSPQSELELVPLPEPNAVFVAWTGDADCDDGRIDGPTEAVCVALFEPDTDGIFANGFDAGSK